jgi:hypothetical protein
MRTIGRLGYALPFERVRKPNLAGSSEGASLHSPERPGASKKVQKISSYQDERETRGFPEGRRSPKRV